MDVDMIAGLGRDIDLGFGRTVGGADDDLNAVAQVGQCLHEPLKRDPSEFVVAYRRYARLRDRQESCSLCLTQPPRIQYSIQLLSQLPLERRLALR